ncbi:MAG TPA: 2-phospho-L-lactate transferase [Mycobacteriales bacterium]|nr:2-phospho-L-lactate transferase [Mycobacteriales bacterium]
MRAVVLAGGVGGGRFLLGARAVFGAASQDPPVTVIGNVGDDISLFGLRISPDLDTVMYTLGGGISRERGWGREAETFAARDELTGYGDERVWFGLGDRDLATHLLRSEWLRDGLPLSAVTARLCERWRPGVRLIPATDDRVETRVQLVNGRDLHFQEWWIRERAAPPAGGFRFAGADRARPAPGVLEAIATARIVLLAPSNPIVSIGAILAVPGIREALQATAAPVVGLSPIIAGAPVRGMADACLAAVGVATSAEAVGLRYGSRRAGGLLDGWLVDEADAEAVDPLAAAGIETRAVPLLMRDLAATTAMVQSALGLATAVRR